MRQGDFARQGFAATTDDRGATGGMMRRAKWASSDDIVDSLAAEVV